jgi:hypothetical protein
MRGKCGLYCGVVGWLVDDYDSKAVLRSTVVSLLGKVDLSDRGSLLFNADLMCQAITVILDPSNERRRARN